MAANQQRSATYSTRRGKTFAELPGARHFSASDLASFAAAETRYRHLVQRLHPDRLGAEDDRADSAEFIEITAAFKRLRDHYRKTGLLPTHRAANQAAHAPSAGDVAAPGIDLSLRRTSARHSRAPSSGKRAWRRARMPLMALAILSLLVLLVVVLDQRMQSHARERSENARPAGSSLSGR